ncbi:MAG: hypothetical protein ACYC92_09875 [Candidatus Acidiferrales bacterium]
MPAFICVDDYLDPDVAYLLGLITARGQFYVEGDIRRLVVNFPYRLFTAKPPEGSGLHFDIPTEMRLCLDDVRNRINELLEVNVQIIPGRRNTQLVAVFTKNTMSWRNLTTLLKHRSSYQEFEVPAIIYETPEDIQLEYARGFADASATPSSSDYEQYGNSPRSHRIVLQVNHQNWLLPIQICRLLQVHLKVPVQHILWGHPNLRDSGNKGKSWEKEHRIRVFAEGFLPVGFHFPFKQRILESMAEINRNQDHGPIHECNPLARHRTKKKAKHRGERSKDLPEALRGKHFNAYFQICKALGCEQGTPSDQLILISEK